MIDEKSGCMTANGPRVANGEIIQPTLAMLALYFLRLGALGFGGPPALAGFMHRDLVDREKWLSQDDYELALTIAQVMPGPLAAQLAIAIGQLLRGIVGATVVALAFVLPSFLMVVALSALYVNSQGLWWVQALFYTIGAAVIAIIALAAYRLARTSNRRDPLRWGIFAALFVATVLAQAELGELFIVAGLLMIIVRAPPNILSRFGRGTATALLPLGLAAATPPPEVLQTLFVFFAKASAFVFGSGLAIVPFLYQTVVTQEHWLTEHQFLDAVAVAIITPGPVVITVAFIGYLVAGFSGATVAALGMFLPTYLLTVVPLPWFRRYRDQPQLRAFVAGATAAATGAIAGAVVVLGQRAITDIPTVLVAVASLAALWRWRVSEPLLIGAVGLLGVGLWLALGRVG
jgi:chromate transporter